MNEKITVVVPIYNVEKYLRECIDSIINQSYHDLEIILVDDGSCDNCPRICDEYEKIDSRIKVIHKENGGLSDARNAGIDIASGEFITFVDSDDFLLPDCLSQLMLLAEKENADFIACRHIRCEEGDTLKDIMLPTKTESITIYSDDSDQMRHFLLGDEIGTTAWAKLYRTSLFDDVRYPVGMYHEDVFTTYKLVHKANRIVCTDKVGYVYRKNNDSITTKPFSEKRLHSIEGKIQQAEFVKEHYPYLCGFAYTGIIYACNQCLLVMSRSTYSKRQTYLYLQKLYRKYGRFYLSEKVSSKGKIITLISIVNVRMAAKCLKLFGKYWREQAV